MPTMTITWQTHVDERTCPVCRPLDGVKWVLDTTTDVFPNYLRDPVGGRRIWDTNADEPLTHGEGSRRGPWNCRCSVSWVFDKSDLVERTKKLLLDTQGVVETWTGIGKVRVVREKGRFVTWSVV